MSSIDWWRSLSRLRHNVIVLFCFDIILLSLVLLNVPGLRLVWELLTDPLPNIAERVLLELIAAASGLNPASTVVGGATVQYATLFFTMATMHIVVGAGIGFLFDHTARTWVWRIINYGVLALVLLVLHAALLLYPFWIF